MMRRWTARAAAVVAAYAIVLPARAQQTASRSEGDSLAPIVSMGQPSPYYPYAGIVGGWDRREGGRRGAARPVVGTDLSFTGRHPSFVLPITEPVRRGGVFGGGSQLRLGWLRRAGRSAWAFGAALPLLQPWAGRTRPHDTDVHPPAGSPPVVRRPPREDGAREDEAMRRMRRAALAIDLLTTPAFRPRSRGWLRNMRRLAARLNQRDDDYPHGHSFPIEIDAYHRARVAAFTAAAAPDSLRGVAVVACARRILLDELLIPYDACYGRFRDPSVLDALEHQDSVFRRLGVSAPVADAPGPSIHPKLHLGTQLFASASALRTMLALPFVYLVASATWVDSVGELDRLPLRAGWFERLLASWEAQVL